MLNNNTPDPLSMVLNEFNDRLNHLESFGILQSKLLNANILRTAAIVEILIKKKILTNDAIEKESKKILKEVKEKAKEESKQTEADSVSIALARMLNSDDVGHA